MKKYLRPLTDSFETLLNKGADNFDEWFAKERHRITITGLSQSGKSMLFTSLMTTLKYRSQENYNCLPLLKSLPIELVERMWLETPEGFEPFPLESHLRDLENQRWPEPTETLYGFKLVVRLRQTGSLKKYLLPHTDVVFEFLDYPGEWITDLPMLSKNYAQWSDSSWAQQMSVPQSFYAHDWHGFVQVYDFDQEPTKERVRELVEVYRCYLQKAKKGGISMLQPGSFLIAGSGFDWKGFGFTPLPAKISSDVSHPWTQRFIENYRYFTESWLKPLKQSSFRQADKQIILVDLLAGLNHSKQHLLQLKETLSHLSETFVYGNPNWFERKVLKKQAIGRVAFVATKADLIPQAQKDFLLALLKDISEGARAKFEGKTVEFEHFLVSAIQATDPGEGDNSVRYGDLDGNYLQVEFEPLPASIKQMAPDEHFPRLEVQVPEDYLPRILNGRGLDRLFQYLLD